MASLSQSVVSSSGGAATITVSAKTGQTVEVYSFDAFTSSGTSGITIADGATTIWRSAAAEVTTTRVTRTWTRPLKGSPGNALTITATSSGGGNTVTLSAQIEQSGG